MILRPVLVPALDPALDRVPDQGPILTLTLLPAEAIRAEATPAGETRAGETPAEATLAEAIRAGEIPAALSAPNPVPREDSSTSLPGRKSEPPPAATYPRRVSACPRGKPRSPSGAYPT